MKRFYVTIGRSYGGVVFRVEEKPGRLYGEQYYYSGTHNIEKAVKAFVDVYSYNNIDPLNVHQLHIGIENTSFSHPEIENLKNCLSSLCHADLIYKF